MTTLVYSHSNTCAAGGHVALSVRLDGGAARFFTYTVDEIMAPMSDEDEIRAAMLYVLKLKEKGRTKNQTRNDVQAGFTVTI